MDRRNAGVPGHAAIAHCPPETHRIEFVGHYYGATSQETGESGSYQAVDMKQRHHAERNVFCSKAVRFSHVLAGDSQILVLQRYTFRTARASAGMQDEGNVLGA